MENELAGNATQEQKELLLWWSKHLGLQGKGFADNIGERMRFVEASVLPMENGPKRQQARVVNEIEVEEDMAQGIRFMHGGCTTYLIDVCSTLVLALGDHASGGPGHPGVSQSLNITFHAPAPVGTKLRIVSTTMTQGVRIQTARAEIWDMEKERLVASGVHVKMAPTLKDTPLLVTKLRGKL